MKTKPGPIYLACIILLSGLFLFVRCKTSEKTGKDEINKFLNGFNNRVKEGNTDSLLAYFDADKRLKVLKRLVNLLCDKKSLNGKEKPLAGISLDVDAARIKIIDDEWVTASIPATFSHDQLDPKTSVLILKIHKLAPHKLKIAQVDARQFLTDYMVYENFVRSKTVDEKDIYSTITLASFKTAAQLKARYDSVIWFAHVDQKTFFYVVKGHWDMEKDINRPKDSVIMPYKMGLVSPDLKEIIPPDFDLIHNISGTFPGLIEVEKDKKRGFYDLDGKIVIPVVYDQVFPIEDDANLAVLRNGADYFYFKKDRSISEKVNLKMADIFSKIKNIANHFDVYKSALNVITEYNSREQNGAVYVPPTYMSDLNMIERSKDFKNPLRKPVEENGEEEDGLHESYDISFTGKGKQPENWMEASFYSIEDYFLGGRSGFYDKKNVVIVDKKKDRIYTQDITTDFEPEGSGLLGGVCDVNSFKVLNDSLFEVKAGAILSIELYDTTKYISGGPFYHYLAIRNNELTELPNNRTFGFTKYVKMDDSYLNACYKMLIGTGRFDKRKEKTIDEITPEMLRYMKNEIYADYRYQFKDKRWIEVFADMASYNNYTGQEKPGNANVDDSLTTIDKYNINWISQKLKGVKTKPNTLAAK
ncbi:WG repeat-containing protein [Mucilaginibacter sp.]|uniref:WG repeat-containing protein n=1 Tax=Mucilaginibacter sp. TaxID=1882438 RepID=UPI00284EBAE2|nr:WG repeat-containing protein [Mucilaginibacter sp.]MDR3697030.1 WG repeat-containing protein [Mucilaginibacter sp.]